MHNVINRQKIFKSTFFSSNVNEVIRAISNIFFTKRFHNHKKHKKAHKQTKIKKAAFLCA